MAKKSVLLLDDPVLLKALCEELDDRLDIASFNSPRQFIDFVQENADDVAMICVDLNLPDMGGVQWQLGGLNVIHVLRAKLGDRTPHACVFTGMDAVVHIHTCLNNGADAFIEKEHSVPGIAARIIEQDAYLKARSA